MKPIIFSTPMVRAILDGRKTMTRRVIKPQPLPDADIHRASLFDVLHIRDENFPLSEEDDYIYANYVPIPYQPGDILWVREIWAKHQEFYNNRAEVFNEPHFIYKADGVYANKWRSPMIMPREAARIFLRVIDVKVERLQDITPYDAWFEGCRIGNSFPWEEHKLQQQCRNAMFKNLWDSLYSKRGYPWESNPWVLVISFERCETTP